MKRFHCICKCIWSSKCTSLAYIMNMNFADTIIIASYFNMTKCSRSCRRQRIAQIQLLRTTLYGHTVQGTFSMCTKCIMYVYNYVCMYVPYNTHIESLIVMLQVKVHIMGHLQSLPHALCLLGVADTLQALWRDAEQDWISVSQLVDNLREGGAGVVVISPYHRRMDKRHS